ncbi:hypothetical protein GQX74_009734 [Glossina fuscipes]|nr:hypothetical protein GQX74_009734 [Glossina fuscipes]
MNINVVTNHAHAQRLQNTQKFIEAYHLQGQGISSFVICASGNVSLQSESIVQLQFLSRYFNDLFSFYFYGILLIIIKYFLSESISRNLEFDIGSISLPYKPSMNHRKLVITPKYTQKPLFFPPKVLPISTLGPLPQSEDQMHILIVIDRFTRCDEAIPVEDITANAIDLHGSQDKKAKN